MRETLTLTAKEQQRLLVMGQLDRGHLTAAEAAELLDRSVRQVRRILAAYRKEGAAALAHGNRGRRPAHAIGDEVRAQVVELARTRYAGLNDTHVTEKLAECEGITLSRATVRRMRRAAGMASPRRRRAPRHRSRRERKAQAGLLVQWDGSQHAWLGERGPPLVLLAAIDDATGTVLAAHVRLQEDGHGYLQLLQDLVTAHGVPVAIYHDRHSIFRLSTPETVAEQLRGQRDLTQVGRALAELGITSIAARSPQAKGRIERLFGTFQDRLVAELRLAEADTLAAANRLVAAYLPAFNARFAVPAADPTPAYRRLAPGQDVASVCCFRYQRTVALDNTVQLGEHRLQLLPGRQRISYARATVDVHERLDGRLVVFYRGEPVASQPAPAEAPVLRARSGRRSAPQPIADISEEPSREELAVVVEGVDVWAGAAAAVHKSTPYRPAPDHPWRQGYTRKGTKSPTS
jgi:transposase